MMKDKRESLPSVSAPELAVGIETCPVLQITPSERCALQLVAKRAPKRQIGAILNGQRNLILTIPHANGRVSLL
jgi:hypothetical protein